MGEELPDGCSYMPLTSYTLVALQDRGVVIRCGSELSKVDAKKIKFSFYRVHEVEGSFVRIVIAEVHNRQKSSVIKRLELNENMLQEISRAHPDDELCLPAKGDTEVVVFREVNLHSLIQSSGTIL